LFQATGLGITGSAEAGNPMNNGPGLALIVATLISSITSIVVSVINSRKITQVHESTNGKMEELVKVVKAASFAEGVKSEVDKSKE
jgi:hypothetical protein